MDPMVQQLNSKKEIFELILNRLKLREQVLLNEIDIISGDSLDFIVPDMDGNQINLSKILNGSGAGVVLLNCGARSEAEVKKGMDEFAYLVKPFDNEIGIIPKLIYMNYIFIPATFGVDATVRGKARASDVANNVKNIAYVILVFDENYDENTKININDYDDFIGVSKSKDNLGSNVGGILHNIMLASNLFSRYSQTKPITARVFKQMIDTIKSLKPNEHEITPTKLAAMSYTDILNWLEAFGTPGLELKVNQNSYILSEYVHVKTFPDEETMVEKNEIPVVQKIGRVFKLTNTNKGTLHVGDLLLNDTFETTLGDLIRKRKDLISQFEEAKKIGSNDKSGEIENEIKSITGRLAETTKNITIWNFINKTYTGSDNISTFIERPNPQDTPHPGLKFSLSATPFTQLTKYCLVTEITNDTISLQSLKKSKPIKVDQITEIGTYKLGITK